MLGGLKIGNYEQSLPSPDCRVGKTVLLDAFSDIAVERGWVACSAEATGFRKVLAIARASRLWEASQ